MPLRPHILVVDDDAAITELLCAYLARFGFDAHAVADGEAMHAYLDRERDRHPVDLVVLDLMLPGIDGLALAQALRAVSALPIIMLTARGSAMDRVVGLEMGADDYMAKPFEPRELVARIQSVLRRAAAPRRATEGDARHLRFDGWMLARDERLLTSPAGVVIALSNAEFRLLAAFLQAPRRVVSREQLMVQARGRHADDGGRSIDLLVSRLRHKLADGDEAAPLIKTVRGAGYLFDARSVQARVGAPG